MGLFKALSGGVGLLGAILSCGAFWLLGAGAWALRHYDELQAVPHYQVHVLFFHWTLKPPHSLWPEYVLAVEARDAQAAKVAASIAQRQSQAAATVQAATSAAIAHVEWRTRTLIQEIPVAVPPPVDLHFPLGVGFVRYHDAAALGVDVSAVAQPAGKPDDSPSVVKPSDLSAILARNYADCRADAAELAGWQDFYAGLRAAQGAPK